MFPPVSARSRLVKLHGWIHIIINAYLPCSFFAAMRVLVIVMKRTGRSSGTWYPLLVSFSLHARAKNLLMEAGSIWSSGGGISMARVTFCELVRLSWRKRLSDWRWAVSYDGQDHSRRVRAWARRGRGCGSRRLFEGG